MSFRKTTNRHDLWLDVVRENSSLLEEVPACMLESEAAFRDYVTSGTHRGRTMNPSVAELSGRALHGLWTFIHQKAHFDMDADSFDLFNKVNRERPSTEITN